MILLIYLTEKWYCLCLREFLLKLAAIVKIRQACSADNLLYLQVWCSYDLDCWLLQTVLNRINWLHLLIGNFSVMSDKTEWYRYVINISETVCNNDVYQIWWKDTSVRVMKLSSDRSGLTQENNDARTLGEHYFPSIKQMWCHFF